MPEATTKLQIRMDRSLKEAADEVFSELGLDSATAVRMFFNKVAKTRSIPFQLKAGPEFSPEQEASILAAYEESMDPANLSKPYSDVSEMFRDIRQEIQAGE